MKSEIIIFLPSAEGGGAERVMITLANCFTKRGYSVTIIFANAMGPQLRNISSKVDVINLCSKRLLHAIFPLARCLRRLTPKVALSAMEHANIVLVLARILSFTYPAVVVSERNTPLQNQACLSMLYSRVLAFFIRFFYRRANAIVAVSESVADDLAAFASLRRDSICVIYNPFNIHEITQKARKLPSDDWFINKTNPVVLGVGRLTTQKDFRTLVAAVAKLQSVISCRLVIIGEGELEHDLMNWGRKCGLSSQNFKIIGFQLNPMSFMKHADVFVLPSLWEGLPGVLIEAMACGTPVVATDCRGGSREILEGGRFGQLTEPGDSSELSKAIERVLKADSSEQPNVVERAEFFEQSKAVDSYLVAMGLPKWNLRSKKQDDDSGVISCVD